MSTESSSPAVAGARQPEAEMNSSADELLVVLPKPARWRLYVSMGVLYTALLGAQLGISSVLLPNQVLTIDPTDKYGIIALLGSLALIAGTVISVVVGALSDRTRTRYGRRSPWLVLGAFIAGGGAFAVAGADNFLWLGIAFVVMSMGQSIITSIASAVAPDRVQFEHRGTVSGWIASGINIGATLGIFAAGALAAQIPLAYAILVGGLVVITLGFVIVNREQSTLGIPREPFAWGPFFGGFWISPVKYPDFAWAFVLRVLVLLGFNIPFAFQFFILTDFIQLSVEEANSTIGMLAIVSLAATLVGTAFSGWLSDRLGKRKLLIHLSVIIMLVSYVLPIAMPDLTGITLYWIVNGVGYGLFVAVDAALMMDVLPKHGVDSGKDLSILNIATALPTLLSTIIASLVITSFGGFNMLFIVAAVLVVLGGLTTFAIKKVR